MIITNRPKNPGQGFHIVKNKRAKLPINFDLNSLNLMCSLGEERFGGPNNNYIKEYFNGKDPAKPAYINESRRSCCLCGIF